MILEWLIARLFNLIIKQEEEVKEPTNFDELDYNSSANWYSDKEIKKSPQQH